MGSIQNLRRFIPVLCLISLLSLLASVGYLDQLKTRLNWANHVIGSDQSQRQIDDPDRQITIDLRDLLKLQKYIAVANRYSRNGQATNQLQLAFQLISSVLKGNQVESSESQLTNNSSTGQEITTNRDGKLDVCEEKWLGIHYGYPRFERGFVSNCSNAASIVDLVSVALQLTNVTVGDLYQILNELAFAYPNLTVYHTGLQLIDDLNSNDNSARNRRSSIVSSFNSGSFRHPSDYSRHVKLVKLDSIADVTGRVDTKYLWLLHSIKSLDIGNSSLVRLLQAAYYGGFDVVGGAYHLPNGYWHRNCYQLGLKNYTLKLIEGYDVSHLGCLLCDFFHSPLLLKTSLFQQVRFDGSLSFQVGLLDWFIRLKSLNRHTVGVCPDVMYSVASSQINPEFWPRERFLPLVQSYNLNRILLDGRVEHKFSCAEAQVSCGLTKGVAKPICCLEELAKMQTFMLNSCHSHGIHCEICSGTMLGACKFGGILPWELDFDISYHYTQEPQLLQLSEQLRLNGYSLVQERSNSGTQKAYYTLNSQHFRGELWGSGSYETSQFDTFTKREKNETQRPVIKLNVYGEWVSGYHNPCYSAASEYGRDIYQHAEHWRTANSPTGWGAYRLGFADCPKPGFHGCLDQFLPDGDLQFRDVYL